MYQKGVEAAIRKRTNEIIKGYREYSVINNIPFTEAHEEIVRNAIRDLFSNGIYPILSEFELNEVAYLCVDEDKLPGLITGINVTINGNTYDFSRSEDDKTVYGFELEKEKSVL